jgi:hypothetical protein
MSAQANVFSFECTSDYLAIKLGPLQFFSSNATGQTPGEAVMTMGSQAWQGKPSESILAWAGNQSPLLW